MDGELLYLLFMFFLWILLGGVALRFSANRHYKKNITVKRAITVQSLMVVVLPFWEYVYCASFGDAFSFPYIRFHPFIILVCSTFQLLVVKLALHLNPLQAISAYAISLIPTYWIFRLAMPSDILVAGARAVATKANGQIRVVSRVIVEEFALNGTLPIPADGRGKDLEPLYPSSDFVASSTEGSAFYYRGPSYVPTSLANKAYPDWKLSDPFRRKDDGPYGYGAGPIDGASAAFILSSYGPDMESRAEELEFLFLERFRGDVDKFLVDPESLSLLYSPTNGTMSPGDLCRSVGKSRKDDKLQIR